MTILDTIKTLFTPQPVEVVAEEPLTDDEQRFLEIISKNQHPPEGEEKE